MKIQAVIFDWAGTTVDHGSLAPAAAIGEIFAAQGVPVTAEEARAPMGLPKLDHIRALCSMPSVRARWELARGRAPAEADVQRLYVEFIPRQIACLEAYSGVIAGVPEAAARLRARGIRIGASTGYTRPMLDLLAKLAAAQGYAPDCSIAPEECGGGRPAPWMCYLNAIRLRVYPLSACVKIGDTAADVEEGRNAGMWTIAVAATGNEIGLSASALAALPHDRRASRLALARSRLRSAGADFVIDSVAHCDEALDEIESRLNARAAR